MKTIRVVRIVFYILVILTYIVSAFFVISSDLLGVFKFAIFLIMALSGFETYFMIRGLVKKLRDESPVDVLKSMFETMERKNKL